MSTRPKHKEAAMINMLIWLWRRAPQNWNSKEWDRSQLKHKSRLLNCSHLYFQTLITVTQKLKKNKKTKMTQRQGILERLLGSVYQAEEKVLTDNVKLKLKLEIKDNNVRMWADWLHTNCLRLTGWKPSETTLWKKYNSDIMPSLLS